MLFELFEVYEHLVAVTLINALLALALFFSLRAGLFNLSAAGFMAIGAYASAILTMQAGTPWLLNCLVAALLGAGLGYLLGLPVMRLRGHYLAMSTLGFGAIVQVVAVNWERLTRGMLGLVDIPAKVRVWHALVLLGFFVYLALAIQRSRTGRAWEAIRTDAMAASTMGINVVRYKMLAFVLSAGVTALGGAFWAHVNRVLVPTEFGFKRLTDILIFALLGGVNHWLGPVLGAAVLTTMPEWFRAFESYRELIIGGLLVVIVVYLPGGLTDLWRLRRARRLVPAVRPRRRDEEPVGPMPAAVPGGGVGGGAMPPSGGALRLESVTKAFGGLRALEDVSLTIEPGRITALIGPNGAGKTTLINIVSGLLKPTAGRIRVDGRDITDWPAHRIASELRIARSYQNIRLFRGMSVLDNVIVGYHGHMTTGIGGALLRTARERGEERDARRAAERILDYVGIRQHGRRLARELSYGDRRRVEIARALMVQPRFLLLDEPSAGMTAAEAEQLARLIASLRQQGVAIVIIEHNMRLVMAISDEVFVLNFGRLIAHGSPEVVQRSPAVIEAYLGAQPAAR